MVSGSYGIPPTPARHALFIVYQSVVPYIAERVTFKIDPFTSYGPRVFFDVTLALKAFRICIFSAEIGRHSISDRKWEVYRFLLYESRGFPLTNNRAKRDIVDKARSTYEMVKGRYYTFISHGGHQFWKKLCTEPFLV
nr:ACT domain-containing protein ACR9-like [Tanacetum cinerariifolium]